MPSEVYCRYISCPSKSNLKKHLYRFPRDPERCSQWVDAAKNPNLIHLDANTLYNRARLCEDHFASWCFMDPKKRSLVWNAVPDVPSRPLKNDKRSDILPSEECTPCSEMSEESCLMPSTTPANTSAASNICMTPKSINVSSVGGSSNIYLTPRSINASSVAALNSTSLTPRRNVGKYTPRKRKLAFEVKKQKDTIRYLKNRYAKLKKLHSIYKRPKKLKAIKDALIQANVDKNLMNLILSQVKLSGTKRQGRRFSNEEKLFAYNLLCKGKAAYRCIKTLIQLPSESSLRNFIAQKFSEPGVNADIINRISACLQNKPITQRVYALVFDETSIKPKLCYNPIADNVSGVEDFGTYGRREIVANQVLVIMLRSLQGKKKLPICYYFSNGSVSSSMLKLLLDEVLEKLTASNVIVKAIICDQGSSNCRLFSLYGITPEKPYFVLDGNKIYGIYDPPHLLKTLRRNLMKYDLKTGDGTVSFKHIIDFYKADSVRYRRTAEKLTDKHVFATGLNSMKW